jgi:hypothetical protein
LKGFDTFHIDRTLMGTSTAIQKGNSKPSAGWTDTDAIFSIASTITKGAARRISKKGPEPAIQPGALGHQPEVEVEDLESIDSFGDGRHGVFGSPRGNTGEEEVQGESEAQTYGQTEDVRRVEEASSTLSENKAYSDAGDDSACMFTEDGAYPGFNVWLDDECR